MPPNIQGVGGEETSPSLRPPSFPLPLPTAALKHLLQVISTFEKKPILSEDLGAAPGPSKGDSEGYIGDRETD